ncbi:S1 RNA-binding domain-containing protein, partial [Chromohalobacter sp. 48-RD10]
VVGDSGFLKSLNPADYVDDIFGVPTISDILKELDKPGRDPRPEFKAAEFREGVETLQDLEPGMILEGSVTNVTHFGAFVDIGVHQDGLVHISALSETFIEDPRQVVKAGDIVKVKVMQVDLERARIGLSMRMGDAPSDASRVDEPRRSRGQRGGGGKRESQPASEGLGALGEALAEARRQS